MFRLGKRDYRVSVKCPAKSFAKSDPKCMQTGLSSSTAHREDKW